MKNLFQIMFAVIFMAVWANVSAQSVNLVSPADISTGQSLTPTLNWSTAGFGGSEASEVFIYSDAGLTTLVHSSGSLGAVVTYVVPGSVLNYNTTYYWVVETDDGVNFVTATQFSFTTLLATPLLGAPANNYASFVTNPNFGWTMDDNKSNVKYELLVGTTPGLTSPANVNTTSAVNPILFLTSTGLSDGTKYYWTVNAKVDDAGAPNNGEEKLATEEKVFYTPINIQTVPINGVTGHTLEPTFSWTDLAWETGYELRISTNGGTQGAFDLGVIFTDLNIPANTTSVSYDENSEDELTPGNFPFPLDPNTTYYWQIYAKDGGAGIRTPIHHFTTYPEVTVSLWNPENATEVYLASVYFSYGINAATNGLKFKLQVKASLTEPTGTEWLTSDFSGVSTDLFQNVNLAGGTKYYWRVILLNSSDQVFGYSETRYFTTTGGAATPTPSWPVENGMVYTYTPTLYWYMNGFAYDLTYDYEVSDDTTGLADFSGINVSNMYYTLATPLNAGTTYYWRVRSVYKRGLPGEETSAYSFWSQGKFETNPAATSVEPNPSYPIDNLEVYTTAPTFYWWLGVSGTGLTYSLIYSTDNTFATHTRVGNIASTYYAVSGLTPGATYYWKVKSHSATDSSNYSTVASFSVVGGTVNSYPVASWPVPTGLDIPVVYTTTPELLWYLEGSSLGITGYVVRWKAGSNSSDWNSDYTGSATVAGAGNTFYTFGSPLTNGTTYYWAVAADGGTIWSEGSFTIFSSSGSGIPVLNYPINGEVVFSTTPTMSWYFNGSTSGIVGYELVYSYSDVFANGATTTQYVVGTSFTVTANLVQGATYWWKVRAHLGGANYSAFSTTEEFLVTPGSSAPIQPIVGGPHNVSILTNAPVISWVVPSGSGSGLTYELEYSNNPSFANSTVINNINTNHLSVSSLSGNTSYFWRVRSKNAGGNYSFHSNMGVFKVTEGATDVKETELVPERYSLSQNFPNPFNPTTVINYELPFSGNVSLRVYDVIGREVTTLVNETQQAGSYSVNFNASNLATGVYYYKISAGSFVSVKKMILVK